MFLQPILRLTMVFVADNGSSKLRIFRDFLILVRYVMLSTGSCLEKVRMDVEHVLGEVLQLASVFEAISTFHSLFTFWVL